MMILSVVLRILVKKINHCVPRFALAEREVFSWLEVACGAGASEILPKFEDQIEKQAQMWNETFQEVFDQWQEQKLAFHEVVSTLPGKLKNLEETLTAVVNSCPFPDEIGRGGRAGEQLAPGVSTRTSTSTGDRGAAASRATKGGPQDRCAEQANLSAGKGSAARGGVSGRDHTGRSSQGGGRARNSGRKTSDLANEVVTAKKDPPTKEGDSGQRSSGDSGAGQIRKRTGEKILPDQGAVVSVIRKSAKPVATGWAGQDRTLFSDGNLNLTVYTKLLHAPKPRHANELLLKKTHSVVADSATFVVEKRSPFQERADTLIPVKLPVKRLRDGGSSDDFDDAFSPKTAEASGRIFSPPSNKKGASSSRPGMPGISHLSVCSTADTLRSQSEDFLDMAASDDGTFSEEQIQFASTPIRKNLPRGIRLSRSSHGSVSSGGSSASPVLGGRHFPSQSGFLSDDASPSQSASSSSRPFRLPEDHGRGSIRARAHQPSSSTCSPQQAPAWSPSSDAGRQQRNANSGRSDAVGASAVGVPLLPPPPRSLRKNYSHRSQQEQGAATSDSEEDLGCLSPKPDSSIHSVPSDAPTNFTNRTRTPSPAQYAASQLTLEDSDVGAGSALSTGGDTSVVRGGVGRSWGGQLGKAATMPQSASSSFSGGALNSGRRIVLSTGSPPQLSPPSSDRRRRQLGRRASAEDEAPGRWTSEAGRGFASGVEVRGASSSTSGALSRIVGPRRPALRPTGGRSTPDRALSAESCERMPPDLSCDIHGEQAWREDNATFRSPMQQASPQGGDESTDVEVEEVDYPLGEVFGKRTKERIPSSKSGEELSASVKAASAVAAAKINKTSSAPKAPIRAAQSPPSVLRPTRSVFRNSAAAAASGGLLQLYAASSYLDKQCVMAAG